MCNLGFELFPRTSVHLLCVGDLVHDGNSFQSLHLFEVNVSILIAIDMTNAEYVRGTIRITFEYGAIFSTPFSIYRHMQEDRVCRAVKHCVRLLMVDLEI